MNLGSLFSLDSLGSHVEYQFSLLLKRKDVVSCCVMIEFLSDCTKRMIVISETIFHPCNTCLVTLQCL